MSQLENSLLEQTAAMERHIALRVEQHLAQQHAAVVQAGAAPAPGGPLERPHRSKLHENARYGGSVALDPWLATMQQYADFYGLVAEDTRISYAVAHLKDAALQWWQSLATATRPTTWETLTRQLRARFQPVTSAELARAKLRGLTQGRGSVQAYVATFNALLTFVPTMAVEDRVFAFVQGLNEKVQAHVDEIAHTSLDSAIERAMRFGSRLVRTGTPGGATHAPMELDALGIEMPVYDTGDDEPTPSPIMSAAAPITRAELQSLLATMLDNRRVGDGNRSKNRHHAPPRARGIPVIPHLSPEQVKAHMDAGKCFGCGSSEHRARQCPRRSVGAEGRPSWSN
jgi:Retrotransposon gag protein